MDEEERAEHIDGVRGVEVGDCDSREGRVEGDTGVVDYDVDLEFGVWGRERGFGGGDELGGPGGGGDVGLDCDGADGVGLGELVCEGGGEGGGGG